MSAQFGVWPPQGRAGGVQAYGRLVAQVGVAGAGTISPGSDIFNNITTVVRNGAGDYTITPRVPPIQSSNALVELQTAGGISAVVIDAVAKTVQVLTFTDAGVAADRAFRLSLFQ